MGNRAETWKNRRKREEMWERQQGEIKGWMFPKSKKDKEKWKDRGDGRSE